MRRDLVRFAGKWENKARADAARPNERERNVQQDRRRAVRRRGKRTVFVRRRRPSDEEGRRRRPKKTKFDPEGWKRARKACFEALRAALDDDDDEEKNAKMVILDDTMHYKSMRREAYRYAREFRAAFIVVHVDVDEKECWLRNSRRDDDDVLKVPRETFERLKTVFERARERNVRRRRSVR